MIATALGHTAHVVSLIARFLQVRIPSFFLSLSYFTHFLNLPPWYDGEKIGLSAIHSVSYWLSLSRS